MEYWKFVGPFLDSNFVFFFFKTLEIADYSEVDVQDKLPNV